MARTKDDPIVRSRKHFEYWFVDWMRRVAQGNLEIHEAEEIMRDYLAALPNEESESCRVALREFARKLQAAAGALSNGHK